MQLVNVLLFLMSLRWGSVDAVVYSHPLFNQTALLWWLLMKIHCDSTFYAKAVETEVEASRAKQAHSYNVLF